MKPFLEVLKRYDRLWEQAEQHLEACFGPIKPRSKNTPHPPLDLKELNTIVTILKRIQDARRAIQLDAIKIQEPSKNETDKNRNEPDEEEQKRILKVLERIEESEEDDLEKSDSETL